MSEHQGCALHLWVKDSTGVYQGQSRGSKLLTCATVSRVPVDVYQVKCENHIGKRYVSGRASGKAWFIRYICAA